MSDNCSRKYILPPDFILASGELSFQRAPGTLVAEHFRESVNAGLGHNSILRRGAAADADRTDNFSVGSCKRQAAFHQNGPRHGQYGVTPSSNGVLQSFGRTLEGQSCVCFSLGNLDAGELRLVHALEPGLNASLRYRFAA